MVKDLWGELPPVENIRTPFTILKEQANLLSRKTKGIVVGEVERSEVSIKFLPDHSPISVVYLKARVPSLGNYSMTLLQVKYDTSASTYPVLISSFIQDEPSMKCDNEEEFISALHHLLSSEPIINAVSSLFADAVSQTKTEVS